MSDKGWSWVSDGKMIDPNKIWAVPAVDARERKRREELAKQLQAEIDKEREVIVVDGKTVPKVGDLLMAKSGLLFLIGERKIERTFPDAPPGVVVMAAMVPRGATGAFPDFPQSLTTFIGDENIEIPARLFVTLMRSIGGTFVVPNDELQTASVFNGPKGAVEIYQHPDQDVTVMRLSIHEAGGSNG